MGRLVQQQLVVRRRARAARPTSTTRAAPPRRSTAATAASPRRSTSAAASAASTWHVPARRPATSDGEQLQARPGLLQQRRQAGSGADAAGLRGVPQREDGRGLHRRQRLQLREHRPAVRAGLPGLPDVVEGLLPRRLLGDGQLHRRQRRGGQVADRDRAARTCGPRCATPATATRSWTMLVQTYPSPIPNGSGFRYSESGYTRQSTGGCGFWNSDANWANGTALPTINNTVTGAISQAGITNAKVLNLSSALNGRRLCETGVGLYEEVGLTVVDAARPRSTGPSGSTRSAPCRRAARAAPTTSRRAAPELLGAAGVPQLRAAGLQRRYAARRHLHTVGQRAGQR